MKDSLDILRTDDSIMHYGVLGMKWGHRKDRYSGQNLANRLSNIEARRNEKLSSNKHISKFNKNYPSGYVSSQNSKEIKKYVNRRILSAVASHSINKKYNKEQNKTINKALKNVPKDKLKEYKKSKKNFEKMWYEYGHAVSERNQDTGSRFYLTKERRQKYNEAAKRFKDSVKDIKLSVMKDYKNETLNAALDKKLNNEYWRKYI